MEVSGASSIQISRSYQGDQSEMVKERAVSVTLYEATTVLRDIADHISRQGSINVPHPDEQQQRWNARYSASQNIASDMELMLACEPDLCIVYYTATSKPVGLMILDKEGEIDECEISGMITDFTEKDIEKKLTEYAVNISQNESGHDGKVYLKAASLGSQEIFRSMGFKDKNDNFLSLNPRESDMWELVDNKWSLKAGHSLSQPAIEKEKKSVTGSSDKFESPAPFAFENIVKDSQLRSRVLFQKNTSSESVINEKDKISEISIQIKPVVDGAERRKRPTLKLNLKETAPNVMLYESSSRQIQKTRSIPPSVTSALERVLPESSPAAVKELDEHLRRIQNYIVQQRQPDAEILKYDSSTIATVISMENTRKFNLNLTLCDSICDALAVLEREKTPSHKRLIFRDTNIGQHYLFADISLKPDAPVSIILFESADLGSINSYTLYERFAHEAKKSPGLSNLRMSIFDVNIQRSPADCLIFCLSFALKSHKHIDFLANFHDSQHADLPITQHEHDVKTDLFSRIGFNLYPSTFLPADFIKHTHSREVIGKRLDSLPANDVSTRNMLTQKILAAEERLTEEGIRYYLPSIEYKRLDLITRTLNAMVSAENPNINIA